MLNHDDHDDDRSDNSSGLPTQRKRERWEGVIQEGRTRRGKTDEPFQKKMKRPSFTEEEAESADSLPVRSLGADSDIARTTQANLALAESQVSMMAAGLSAASNGQRQRLLHGLSSGSMSADVQGLNFLSGAQTGSATGPPSWGTAHAMSQALPFNLGATTAGMSALLGQSYPSELAPYLQLQALGRLPSATNAGLQASAMAALSAGHRINPMFALPYSGLSLANTYLDSRNSMATALGQYSLAAARQQTNLNALLQSNAASSAAAAAVAAAAAAMRPSLPPMMNGPLRGLYGAANVYGPMLGASPLFATGGGHDASTTSQGLSSDSGHQGIPLSLPVILAQPEDSLKLSSHQVLLRHQIEAFQASEDDVSTHTRGRNKPITAGQVGIRCRHCAHLPVARRQKGSTYFPATLLGLYQAAQNMSTTHMQCGLCTEMPDEIKQQFVQLLSTKVASSGAGRPYWAQSAKKFGLVDSDEGIRFIRDLPPGLRVNTEGSDS